MSATRRARCIALAALSVLGATTVAWGKPAASAQAEALFDDAKQLMAQKRYAEACDKFDSSQKLDPAVTTLMNAADCREKNRQLATAWGLFVEVERQTRGNEVMRKLHSTAQDRAKKLEARLSHLTIKLDSASAGVAGLSVTVGGEPVLPGTFGTALPMDGGTYTVTASAPRHNTFTQSIALGAERDNKTISIPGLGAAGSEVAKPTGDAHPAHETNPASKTGSPPQQARPITVDKGDHEPSDADPSHPRSRKGAVIAAIAAVALGGGAVVFELQGRSILDESKREFDHVRQDELYDEANTQHWVAQGMAVAAVAVTGVAVYLWVRRGKSASSSSAMLVPTAGSDHAGLVFAGSWR